MLRIRLNLKKDEYERAYFECIRQGYFNIINSISNIKILHRSELYDNIHFSLALSGMAKTKYFDDYIDCGPKFTELIVKSMQIQDRYAKIVAKMNC